MQIKKFTFNPIQENMYVVYDETKECIIIDPGCYFHHEREELADFISDNNLKPVKLINTHCHLDHICGNKYVAETWKLKLEANKLDEYNLQRSIEAGILYNMPIEPSPPIEVDLKEGEEIQFGNSRLSILFTPGHSSGSISFYSEEHKFLIAGDVLFRMSIGRTDLPGGDFDTLISTIKTKLFILPKDTVVYSGHGDETTIGDEMKHNPFLV
jgi:glyoxylase-like metal-dependent hydrolase (beta-lactamase superfamily II)